MAFGKFGVYLFNIFNIDRSEIGVRVYINNKKVVEWFLYFESRKEEIEFEIGSLLVWNFNLENWDKVIVLIKYFNLD